MSVLKITIKIMIYMHRYSPLYNNNTRYSAMCMLQSICIFVCCVATTINEKSIYMFLYLEHWFKHIFLVFYNGQDVFALFVAFITLIMVRFHWKQTYNLNKFNVKCHNLTFERHPVVFCFLFGLIFMATNIIIFYSIKMVWHIHIFNINSTVAINLTFYIKQKFRIRK